MPETPHLGGVQHKTPQLALYDMKEEQISQMTKLLTPSLMESPKSLWNKFIFAACLHNLILSVIIQSLWE